ncbi:acyltransferase [Frondihabitans australicus]|uniref:Surface polysaccharide O-acyltransferase-like enzyme n=1 Tax=Frondihabitans australicus TaxID=386892 RepID=A0A495IKM0_9MICO|nr:acyltransferase [Frondihabitans australicus]RKR76514.1 surface polysaccharide O-acyltransferase-like enzyme [Frondihabitans australicus]
MSSASPQTPHAPATPSAPRSRAPRLHEIDVVRILTFACVIGVHTTSHTVASTDVPLYGLLALLHFTRQVFFALTAFVLAYGYFAKAAPAPFLRSLPRRLLLVGVPYVTWSVIYFAASNLRSPHYTFGEALAALGLHLVQGTAWYHLYFLLVTMQVYVLFPVFLWVVRKTARFHWLLLSLAFAYQLVITWFYRYSAHSLGFVSAHSKSLFVSYIFFILAGTVAAYHAKEFLAWVRSHRGVVAIITAATGVGTLVFFGVSIANGVSLYRAGTPLQPVIMVWAVGVGLGFLAFGTWWADRRVEGSSLARGVAVVSDRSFGIFLAHPMILWLMLFVGDDWVEGHVPTPWLTLVCYVIVVLLAYGISTVARRTPVSLPLAWRPWRARRRGPAGPAVAKPADAATA